MNPRDVQQQLQRQPFQPLRVVMNNGQVYEIRHPEMVQLTRMALYVFKPSTEDAAIAEELTAVCSLRNISTLEPLPNQAA